MLIDFSGVYQGVEFNSLFTGGLLKLLIAIVLFTIIFYSFMLVLKIRVLQDTVEVSPTGLAKTIIMANLLISLGGSLIAFILILL